MAEEEIRANLPAGNGERMELRVGTKSLGFTTKDLVSVLIVVVLAGFGYFMAHNVSEGQRQGFAGIAQILDRMNVHQQQNLEKMSANQQTLLDLVHTNRAQMVEELGRQNQQVSAQTAHLEQALAAQTQELRQEVAQQKVQQREQAEVQRRYFAVVLHKLQHPDMPVSLDIPLPPGGQR